MCLGRTALYQQMLTRHGFVYSISRKSNCWESEYYSDGVTEWSFLNLKMEHFRFLKPRPISPITSLAFVTAGVSIQRWAIFRPLSMNGKWQHAKLLLCLDYFTVVVSMRRNRFREIALVISILYPEKCVKMFIPFNRLLKKEILSHKTVKICRPEGDIYRKFGKSMIFSQILGILTSVLKNFPPGNDFSTAC